MGLMGPRYEEVGSLPGPGAAGAPGSLGKPRGSGEYVHGGSGGVRRDKPGSPRSPRCRPLTHPCPPQAMAAPRPPRVVPGEASESDSEPELLVETAGEAPAAGLKVPGEASETDEEEEEEEEQRPKTPPVLAEEPAAVWGGGPSLLQQRLREGTGRLRGAVGSALRHSYGSAARSLGGLGGALGRAQVTAAAAAHCLRLARRDLRAVADTIDIVTACHLLPDIRGQL